MEAVYASFSLLDPLNMMMGATFALQLSLHRSLLKMHNLCSPRFGRDDTSHCLSCTICHRSEHSAIVHQSWLMRNKVKRKHLLVLVLT
jgi:hypothetical protein